MSRYTQCYECKGIGVVNEGKVECPICKGFGQVQVDDIDITKFDDENLNFEILAEECAEIIQVLANIIQMKSKISRFGIDDVSPKDIECKNNRIVITQEIGDFLAMVDILTENGSLSKKELDAAKYGKLNKLSKYYWYKGRK